MYFSAGTSGYTNQLTWSSTGSSVSSGAAQVLKAALELVHRARGRKKATPCNHAKLINYYQQPQPDPTNVVTALAGAQRRAVLSITWD